MKLKKLLKRLDSQQLITLYDIKTHSVLYDKIYMYSIWIDGNLTDIFDYKVEHIRIKEGIVLHIQVKR